MSLDWAVKERVTRLCQGSLPGNCAKKKSSPSQDVSRRRTDCCSLLASCSRGSGLALTQETKQSVRPRPLEPAEPQGGVGGTLQPPAYGRILPTERYQSLHLAPHDRSPKPLLKLITHSLDMLGTPCSQTLPTNFYPLKCPYLSLQACLFL